MTRGKPNFSRWRMRGWFPRRQVSFIEIMMALSMMMVALVPLIGMFSSNSAITVKQATYIQALNILDSTLNHVVSRGFSTLKERPGNLLNDCNIQTANGSLSWNVTNRALGDAESEIKATMDVGQQLYNLVLKVEVLFWGREDWKTNNARLPFTFTAGVYTRDEGRKSNSSYWDDDPDFKTVVPITFYKHSEAHDPNPFILKYYSPERIYRIIATVSWKEKNPKVPDREVTLVTYRADLSR